MNWSNRLNPINLVKSPSRANTSTASTSSNANDLSRASHASGSGIATRRVLGNANVNVNVNQVKEELASSLSMLEDDTARKRSSRNPFSDNSQSLTHISQSQIQPGNTGGSFQSFSTPAVFSTPVSKKERRNTNGSVRSILRGPNTPGTGQSVRFFSKDAYRLISPNHSLSGSFDRRSLDFVDANHDHDHDRDHSLSPNNSPSNGSAESIHDSPLMDPPASLDNVSRSESIVLPDLLPNGTNLFDMSLDMPVISGPPEGASNMLSDDAVEVPEFDMAKPDVRQSRPILADMNTDTRGREYEQYLEQPSGSRRFIQTSFEISNDTSAGPSQAASLVTAPTSPISSNSAKATADSESAGEGTSFFWTAKSLLTSRFFSKATPNPTSFVDAQLELIQSLREELGIQRKIGEQYQIDLDSRDELVEILSARIEIAETELEAWRADDDQQYELIQVLKKQLLSLERAFNKLQGNGCGMNQDASILGPLNGTSEAMKALQERVKLLEQEKGQLEDQVQTSADQLADVQEENDILRSQVSPADHRDDTSVIRMMDERQELREKVQALEEADEAQRTEIMQLQEEIARLKKINTDASQSHRTAANEWQEERDDLMSKLAEAELGEGEANENASNSQVKMLQEELEAQWERMEQATEQIKTLEKENQELKCKVETLEANGDIERVEELAEQLNDALANQQALEEERDQISEELSASQRHVDNLMQSHSDLQRKLEAIKEERSFASDNGHRLEHAMETRDREIEQYEEERRQQFEELESLRDRISSLEKEHRRQLADRARQIEDLERQLQINSEHSTQILNDNADRDVYMAALEEKAETRLQDANKLRQRIHELEQESAAKEVRLVDLRRDRDRAKEDNINLNIALDSKQQELELIKRKLGVKGTAGATPAPASRARNGPRESSIFGMTPRPLVGLNDTFAKTPGTILKAAPTGSSVTSRSTVSTDSHYDAKVGPPTINKPRVSVSSPTPLSRPFSTASATPRQNYYEKTSTTTQLGKSTRRTESTLFRASSTNDSVLDEKENQAPLRTNKRSNLMIPA